VDINNQEHKTCPISGSSDLKPMKGYEKYFLVKSQPAGFVFSAKIPTEKELEDNYSGYSPMKYFSPVTKTRYKELLNGFQQYNTNNRLHDLGCGSCLFLSVAKEENWDITGNEVSDAAVSKCKECGIEIKNGDFDSNWFESESIDVVTAFEVLEHLADPVDELKKIHRVLRKGGLFCFTTPNFNAIERYLLKSNYNILSFPDHLAYYTPKTVDFLMTKNGFRKVKLQTTGFSVTRIKTSLQMKEGKKVDEPMVSKNTADEKIRATLQNNSLGLAAKAIANAGLNMLGVGNSLKGWYIKV
jgi:2-polyprenyl-3-methyl-5-hydroxy-6-metoxy-1,4-benzoquinol methylase